MSVGFEFLIVLVTLIVLVFFPGVLLTWRLFPAKQLDILERIPIGFGLMGGVLAVLFFFARLLAWDWFRLFMAWIGLILFLMGVTWILPRIYSHQWSPKSQFARWVNNLLPCEMIDVEPSANQRISRPMMGSLVLVLVLSAFLTHIGPVDVDDWSYFQIVREFADANSFAPVSLSDRNVVHVWWLIHAAIVHTFDVDPVRLGQDWMPLLFVPVSLLALYAMARALFLNRNQATAAVLLQFVFLIPDLFNPIIYVPLPGQWLFTRIDQDHTIAIFLFLPVFVTLVAWYLRKGGWVLLGATLVALTSLVAVHALLGSVLSALTLVSVLVMESIFVRQPQLRKRVVWLGILSSVFFGVLSPVLPTIFRLSPASISALRLAQSADGVFPFTIFRYTFFAPTVFTLRADFLAQPPALAAIMLTPFLIPFLRKDFAARYLFVSSIGLLSVLYVPPILQWLESRMTMTVLRFWIWNPKALIIAYFLPYFYLIAHDGWSALRRRVWNTRVFQATILIVGLIGLLAIWPMFLRDDWPPELGAGHALPSGAPEMLKALRDRTAPGEPAVVLAWLDITDAIPAYRSTLSPVLFREGSNDSQRRDADRFFGSTFVTDAHLDILNSYQVNYLIVSGDREFVSQFDHLPEYFQPLYRNSYGALYRVDLPLEPNTLIEANTIANYGEWDSAIKAYNAVLEDDPNNSLAHTGLGIILELLGKPRQAVREFEAAVNASPVNAQAHYHLVNLYRKLGMDEEAAKHVQPAGRLMENSHTWNLEK